MRAPPRDRLGRPLPAGSLDERRYPGDPAAYVSSVEAALRVAAKLCEQARYFEAHEFLEYAWRSPRTREADRSLWKGAAQAAVAACHLARGNPRGAATLARRALRSLAPYPSAHLGLDVAALRSWAARTTAALAAGARPPQMRLRPTPAPCPETGDPL